MIVVRLDIVAAVVAKELTAQARQAHLHLIVKIIKYSTSVVEDINVKVSHITYKTITFTVICSITLTQ